MEQPGISYNTGPNFPSNWDPRYAIAAGMGANPDHRENYRINKASARVPASGASNYVSTSDNIDGFIVNGTLPASEGQGVHSLTDVPVVRSTHLSLLRTLSWLNAVFLLFRSFAMNGLY